MTYRVLPALFPRLPYQFHPQPYFLFIISLQPHRPSCCFSRVCNLLPFATPLMRCSACVLVWLMPSLLWVSAQCHCLANVCPDNTSLFLSPCHALFSHSTYHHLTLHSMLMSLCVCFLHLHTGCVKTESVLFIIPSSEGTEKYSGMDSLNGWIQKCSNIHLVKPFSLVLWFCAHTYKGRVCVCMCVIHVLCCSG